MAPSAEVQVKGETIHNLEKLAKMSSSCPQALLLTDGKSF